MSAEEYYLQSLSNDEDIFKVLVAIALLIGIILTYKIFIDMFPKKR